jgi:membrane-associated phospholipid phosphatase
LLSAGCVVGFGDYVLFMDRVHWADGWALFSRVVGPALVLWGVLVGLGFVITGPLSGQLQAEVELNKDLAADRSHTLNTITLVASYLGGTEVVIGASLIVGAMVVWRTRDWRLAAVPAIAILLETAIFLSIAGLVDRERPPVHRLDVAPPTSSYPSGHVGASTALYLAFAILALRIERSWLRRTAIFICLATPPLVAFARLYRGMHYATDVAAGLIAGVICALLACGWYRHRVRDTTVATANQQRS